MHYIVSALLVFVLTAVETPDYKIKKRKVYKDKVEIGSISGQVGMAKKTDLTFSDASANPVLTVKEYDFNGSVSCFVYLSGWSKAPGY